MTVPSITAPVSFSYNADGQRVLKDSSAGPTAYLYDLQRILHETDDVGGEVTRTYACSTTDEFGDLIGEDGLFEHVCDAQARARRGGRRNRSDARYAFARAMSATLLAAMTEVPKVDVCQRADRS